MAYTRRFKILYPAMIGFAAALSVGGAASALAAEATVAVSPGSATGTVIGDTCPTFSWGAVAEAKSYELLVYRVVEEGEEAQEVLRQSFVGSVYGWTPALDSCLERGGEYAWSVRAVGPEGRSDWSAPSLFKVAAGPSEAEFEAALAVVRQYLGAEGDATVAKDVYPVTSDAPMETGSSAPDSAEGSRTALAPSIVSLVTEGAVGVGADAPQADLHVVGSPTLGSILVAPDEQGVNAGSELLFAEDDDGTFGIKLEYDGPTNTLGFFAKEEAVTRSLMTILRDNGAVNFFGDSVNFSGTVSGDGSGLTNLQPGNLSGAVPVSKGGTGATDATTARTNLGVVAGPHTIDTTCDGAACDGSNLTNVVASDVDCGGPVSGCVSGIDLHPDTLYVYFNGSSAWAQATTPQQLCDTAYTAGAFKARAVTCRNIQEATDITDTTSFACGTGGTCHRPPIASYFFSTAPIFNICEPESGQAMGVVHCW